MKNRKGMAKRVLSLLLAAAMTLSAMPASALAVYAEDAGSGLCAHHADHTEECGYTAVREEVPCDRDCTDTDGDGAIDHAEDCAYTPAEEGQSCAYVCNICPAQALIDALPEAGDITADHAEEVRAQLSAIDEALAALTEEERGQTDTGRYTDAVNALAALEQETEPEKNEPEEQEPEKTESEEAEPVETQPEEPELEKLTTEGETAGYVPDADSLPDNDELFAGYVMRTLYGESGIATLNDYGESAFSGINLELYNALKAEIQEVAANGGSTVFTVTLETPITWKSTAATNDELGTEADKAFQEAVDHNKVIDCLLADCPYEMYWFDRTEISGIGYSSSAEKGTGTISEITFTFYVAEDYRDSGNTTVSAEKATAAATAAANAQTVVADNEGKSDYEKLVAYKEYICNAVSYNTDAANPDNNTAYGDPWQLIYVFDGDTDTNVVCEGYAKAFQYLCDLSSFSGDVTCYTVTGTLSGGTGAGEHMWNIVTLDSANYLVDVTNSDTGTVGQDGGLFLAGTSGNVDTGYTFTIGNQSVTFTYDSDTKSLYGDNILTLAAENYTEPEPEPEYVASVTIGDETRNYTNFNDAWSAAQAATSTTVTLLADVTVSSTLSVENGDDITLTCEPADDEHTISVSSGVDLETPLYVTGGSFTLQRGALKGTDTGKGCIVSGGYFTMLDGTISGRRGLDVSGGHIKISGGTISGDTSFFGSGLRVLETTAEVSLSGGFFSGNTSVDMWAGGTIGSILAPSYAYKGINWGVQEYWLSEAAASLSNSTTPVTVQKAPIQSVSISPDATATITYGATVPILTATATLVDTSMAVTYQWYQDGVAIENATSSTYTPDHLDVGDYSYTCKASADGYSLTSKAASVKVDQREAKLAITGTTTKTYDGTTDGPAGLSIRIENIVSEDDVIVTAESYTYNSANVEEANTIIAGGVTLSGADSGNYKLPEGTITTSGTITKSTPVITFLDYPITKTYSGEALNYQFKDHITVSGASIGDVVFSWKDSEGKTLDSAPVNAGTYTIIATIAETKNTAEATNSIQVYILTRTVSDPTITLEKDSYEYDRTEKKPAVKVFDGETEIDSNEYTVTYSNNTDVGTATVTIKDNEGGNYEIYESTAFFQITKPDLATATVTLALPDDGYTYDGTAKEPGVTVEKNGNTLAESTDYTVTYAENTNAGTATVTVKAVEGGNYSGSNSKTFEIKQANINSAVVTLTGTRFEYIGGTEIAVQSVVLNDTTLTYGTDYTYSGHNGKDVGTYTVTVEGKGNYTGTATAAWEIYQKELTVGNWTIKKAYDGTTDITLDADDAVLYGVCDQDDVKLDVSGVTAQFEDAAVGGSKSITYTGSFALTGEAAKNYVLKYQPTLTGTITKTKAPTVQEQSRNHLRDESVTGTIDLGELLPANKGETSYTVTDSEGVATGCVEGDTLTYTTAANTAAVSGDLTVTVVMQNYKDVTITVKVNLIDPLAVSGLPGVVTYGDAPFTLTASGGLGDAAVIWESSDEAVAKVDGKGTVTITGAGEVTITAAKKDGANEGEATAAVTFTVAKKAVTVSGITAGNKAYDGTTDAVLNYENVTFDGIVAGDSLTVTAKGTFAGADAGEGKSVSITGLTLGGADAGNYVLAEDGQQTETTANIVPKDITVSITPNGGVYGGTITPARAELNGVVYGDTVPVTLTYTGTANDGTTTYHGTDVPTEAGSYTVTASTANGNYSLTGPVAADFVVDRADPAFSVSPGKADKTYGDDTFALVSTHKSDGEVTYESDDSRVATVEKNGAVTLHNVGTATITVTLAQTANYEGAEISVGVTVARKDDTLAVEKLAYTVVYGGDDFTIGYTTVSGSKAAFTSSDTSVAAVDADGKVHIAGVGTATITLKTGQSENYNAVSQTVTVTVQPREITVTADDRVKDYGEDDQELTYTAPGVLDGDDLKITLSRAAGKDAGEYDITADLTNANPNYEIRFVDGTLTIMQRDISNAVVELGAALIENGEIQTQEIRSVTVQNSRGEAMDVTCEVTGNTGKDWGTYTMTITGAGNFTGTITRTFVIAPAADSEVELGPDDTVEIGDGSIGVEVQHAPGAPTVTLRTGKAEILEMLTEDGHLSAEELAQAANGADIDIILKVTDASDAIGADSRAQIEKAASGYVIGQYLDISLYKQITVDGRTGELVPITGVSGGITVSVKIPKELLNTDEAVTRTFWILRNHEGAVDFLATAYDAQANALTFTTDRFSDYAIVYQDSGQTAGDDDDDDDYDHSSSGAGNGSPAPMNTALGTVPPTGDDADPWLWMLLLLFACGGAAVVFRIRKKGQDGTSA